MLLGLLRFLAFVIVAWAEVGLVATALHDGATGLLLLGAYWVGAAFITRRVFRSIEGGQRADRARVLQPLVLSFFFFPFWFFWGFIPLPIAFFMAFSIGSAAPWVPLIALVWVPLGAGLLALSRPIWIYPWARLHR